MALPLPGKRGRPRKDDPRHLQRQAEQLAMRIEFQEVLEPGRIAKKSSGLPTGVSHTDTGKFQARIKLDGKRINLGSFDTAEDAAAAYRTAKASGFTCAESPQIEATCFKATGFAPSCTKSYGS